ncbi:hypothetical protein [Kitasatospora cheerisanensis]|uniref:Uncharacterized protein n=1 Tax=Kitasatospora cheerisanensis KCTC 2395 TaxID=1348663 RepID=A0A066YZU0_9ACTN|nr:hypothetical protein [Kitasatospora cheerisanensis]KDN86727.1 hypothetical protein KCH_15150 [Kitasatospora cheerisanensis KCTC 2395]
MATPDEPLAPLIALDPPTTRWTVTADNVWDVLDATDQAGLWTAKMHYGSAEWIPPSTVIDGITLMPPHVPTRTVAYFGDTIVLTDGAWSVERAEAGTR